MQIEIVFVRNVRCRMLPQRRVYRMHMQIRAEFQFRRRGDTADDAKILEIMRRWRPFHGI